MTVSECAVGMQSMSLDELRSPIPFSRVTGNAAHQLRAMAALCNAAELDASSSDLPLAERKIFGDATDSAVLRMAEHLESGSVAYLRACWRRTFDLAFNSKNKFMIRCFSNTRPECIAQTLSTAEANMYKDSDM